MTPFKFQGQTKETEVREKPELLELRQQYQQRQKEEMKKRHDAPIDPDKDGRHDILKAAGITSVHQLRDSKAYVAVRQEIGRKLENEKLEPDQIPEA